jgi:hypothetical protein
MGDGDPWPAKEDRGQAPHPPKQALLSPSPATPITALPGELLQKWPRLISFSSAAAGHNKGGSLPLPTALGSGPPAPQVLGRAHCKVLPLPQFKTGEEQGQNRDQDPDFTKVEKATGGQCVVCLKSSGAEKVGPGSSRLRAKVGPRHAARPGAWLAQASREGLPAPQNGPL